MISYTILLTVAGQHGLTLHAVPQRVGLNDDLTFFGVLSKRHEQTLLQLKCSRGIMSHHINSCVMRR
jgi:hypothetical protein